MYGDYKIFDCIWLTRSKPLLYQNRLHPRIHQLPDVFQFLVYKTTWSLIDTVGNIISKAFLLSDAAPVYSLS